jgi:hypothetical protein
MASWPTRECFSDGCLQEGYLFFETVKLKTRLKFSDISGTKEL